MNETVNMETHLSSAAAFVEGGIQEACHDACSICLESFTEDDPAAMTVCKHEFHLQCILEWCQRSSQCPMCWQSIHFIDPSSQELLEAIEKERDVESSGPQNTTIFHHPTYGTFELANLPGGLNRGELEDLIMQHLSAAAGTRRMRRGRREPRRGRLGSHPESVVSSADQNNISESSEQRGRENEPGPSDDASRSVPRGVLVVEHSSQVQAVPSADHLMSNSGNRLDNHLAQDTAEQSDSQSFSESLKSRFSNISLRCKESITKNTRGWKERLFSRSNPVPRLGPEVQREVNVDIPTMSRQIDHIEMGESCTSGGSASVSLATESVSETSDNRVMGNPIHDTEDDKASNVASGSS